MKKLVTLSAIALAGATLGVGTTFGWWSDDPEDQPTKTPPSKTLEVSPADLKATSIEVFVADEAPALEVKTKAPYPLQDVSGKIRFVQASTSQPALEKLADELEQEAKEFEGHGQKELAEVQRKLAQRLRATLKAGQAQGKVLHLPADAKPRYTKVQVDPKEVDAKGKSGAVEIYLKGRDADPKGKGGADLKARIHELEANPKAHPEAEQQLKKLRSVLEQQARIASEQDHAHAAKEKELDHVIGHMKATAEKLEQAGRKDEAHAIREKAEQLQKSFEQEAGEDRKPKFEKHDIVLDDEPRKVIRFRKEFKSGEGKEGVAIIEVDPKGEGKGVGKEKGPVTDPEATARITVSRLAHVDGAPLFEIQRTLKELRTEIQELREEVRGLRGLLGADVRSVKKKFHDDDDDDDDDDGVKQKGDADKEEKPDPKDRKVRYRVKESDDNDDAKEDKERKSGAGKPDDDDDVKSDKREDKDDDRKSDDRKEKDDDDDDESAQAQKSFRFYTGIFK